MMTSLANNLISVLSSVPAVLVYVIAAIWMGLESAGIGVPIEPMMLFVGSLATKTTDKPPTIFLPLAILCVVLGCVVFSFIAYQIGAHVGTAALVRVGHYVGLTQERADHVELWLRHRGGIGVFIARETPMVRTYGSFIMGAASIPMRVFLIGTFLGSLLYCSIFLTLGYALGANYRAPLTWLDDHIHIGPGEIAIVVGVIVALLALHRFWEWLARQRIAQHYHQHAAQPAPVATASSGLM